MKAKQMFLEAILVGFTGLSAYAVYQYGYVGFFELLVANVATLTAFADLTIALTLILVWLWNDARSRGLSPLPYVGLTLVLGSVGPLVYLIRREYAVRAEAAARPVTVQTSRSAA